MLIRDIQKEPEYFGLPKSKSPDQPEIFKETLLKRYKTDTGILNGLIDGNRIILQWYPENIDQAAEAYHNEALELAKVKQYHDAILKWQKAISLNDQDVDYLYKLGLIYFEIKKYQDAIRYIEEAIRICPIHYRAQLLLGINWMKLRKFDRAEVHVLESNRLNKTNILTYLNLGAIYSIQKRFNDAIDMFNSTIKLSPKESRAYLGLARIYNMLNDVETSNSYFRKVIELSPGTQMAEYARRSIRLPEGEESDVSTTVSREELFAKGMEHYLSGNYQASAAQYKEYLKVHPSDDYAWYLLGETKLRTGELEQSTDCFKRSVRLNPKRGLYYKSLGVSLHLQNKSYEAIEVFKKAIELGKKDILCITMHGINLLKQKKTNDAIHSLKYVLKKFPNNPLALYTLALAFVQNGNKADARILIEKLLNFEYFIPLKNQAKNLLRTITPQI